MNGRAFLLASGALFAPLAIDAQQPAKPHQVAFSFPGKAVRQCATSIVT